MKMAAALPDADSNRNGLEQLTKDLVEEPDRPILAIVLLDSSVTTVDHLKHTKTPTVRIMHIEPMITVGTRREAAELLTRAYAARTSEQLELPLGLIDPTGERFARESARRATLPVVQRDAFGPDHI